MLLVFCAINNGCWFLSLYPIYTYDDVIFEPALLGTWSRYDDNYKYALEFTQPDETNSAYVMTYTQVDNYTGDVMGGVFEAHLIRIGQYTILDLYPIFDDTSFNSRDIMNYNFMVLSHYFVLVGPIGTDLNLSHVDVGWLTNYLEIHPDELKHEYSIYLDGRLLLTATTEELQAFMIKHLGTDAEFWDEGPYTRADDAASTTEDGIAPIPE